MKAVHKLDTRRLPIEIRELKRPPTGAASKTMETGPVLFLGPQNIDARDQNDHDDCRERDA